MSIDTRDPLVPDPEEPPPPSDEPVADEVLSVPGQGLEPREGRRKRVVVIGAGMAGLVAAFELARQGHDPLILEAQNRVGGRVYTLRSFAPGLYAEAGAMRIPRVHDLTLKYVNLFGLSLRPFMMGNPKGLVHVGGRRMTAEEAHQRPADLPFDVAEHERGRSSYSCVDAPGDSFRPVQGEFGAVLCHRWHISTRRRPAPVVCSPPAA